MTETSKTALIIGGSRGVGRSIALSLSESGHRTVVVARNQPALDELQAEAPAIETIKRDATQDGAAKALLADVSPDLLILSGGHAPKMGSFASFTWEEFSAPWTADTKISFSFLKAALSQPMRSGGTVLSFASGAAITGSRLSGGYAGAKRMQHYLSNYSQAEAKGRGLDLTFVTLYPCQLIAGTDIGLEAAECYAEDASMSVEQFMGQWDKPLTPDRIAGYVADMVAASEQPKAGAYMMRGTHIEAMS